MIIKNILKKEKDSVLKRGVYTAKRQPNLGQGLGPSSKTLAWPIISYNCSSTPLFFDQY